MYLKKTEKTEKQKSPFGRFFVSISIKFDRLWRLRDFNINRSYGGILEKYLKADGHAPLAVVLLIPVMFFLIYGPTAGWRGLGALVFFLVSSTILLLGIWYLSYLQSHKQDSNNEDEEQGLFKKLFVQIRNPVLWFQLALIIIISVLVFVIADPGASETKSNIYLHIMIPLVIVLVAFPMILARFLAKWLFTSQRKENSQWVKNLLKRVELFRTPVTPLVDKGKIVRSFLNAPLRYPLHLLFCPAVVALMVPNAFRESLGLITLVSLLIASLVSSFGSINQQFEAMLTLTNRTFFVGGQLIVSLFIIMLAFGRIFEFGYISTVVEGSPATLGWFIVASYFAFWYYEYWINRILSEEIIGFLGNNDDPIGQAKYPIDEDAVSTIVERENRVIQIHGGARFMTIGRFNIKKNGESYEAFEPYNRIDLFDRLVENAPPDQKLSKVEMRQRIKDLRSRVRFYFSSLNVILVLLFVGGAKALSLLPQEPGAKIVKTASPGSQSQLVDLGKLIFEPNNDQPRNAVILLAASGGGTRAALYTASVLHGLAEQKLLENVVLASGVSGGGASLAYFAAHRDVLINGSTDEAWKKFYEDMSSPFIKDVLEKSAEWRVMAGTRLGKLLDESFTEHFNTKRKLGDVSDLGLIFNTALAGHLRRRQDGPEPFAEWAEKNRILTKSDIAGGRRIFTNLDDSYSFLAKNHEKHQLRYVVIRDGSVALTTGAALNANFPPVFSNAAVDVVYYDSNSGDRYWVTDGGATDNRGIISLLLALREALRYQVALSVLPKNKPDIHIIVAEASAASIDYKQDRGLGTKFGASEKFASQLMAELEEQVKELYHTIPGETKQIKLHYLTMPSTLRMRGGLGTHWMLPELVRLADPKELDPKKAQKESVVISSYEVRNFITRLHQPKLMFNDEPGLLRRLFDSPQDLIKVNIWIENDEHRTNWKGAVESLMAAQAGLPLTRKQ